MGLSRDLRHPLWAPVPASSPTKAPWMSWRVVPESLTALTLIIPAAYVTCLITEISREPGGGGVKESSLVPLQASCWLVTWHRSHTFCTLAAFSPERWGEGTLASPSQGPIDRALLLEKLL